MLLALQRQTAAGVNFKMSSAYALLIVSSRSMQLIFPAGPLLGETGYFRAEETRGARSNAKTTAGA